MYADCFVFEAFTWMFPDKPKLCREPVVVAAGNAITIKTRSITDRVERVLEAFPDATHKTLLVCSTDAISNQFDEVLCYRRGLFGSATPFSR